MNGCSYTYMLRCVDGKLNTGWTNDLSHRVCTRCAGIARVRSEEFISEFRRGMGQSPIQGLRASPALV